jgi:transglutaminase-like putative cysteine protease
LYIRHRTSYRYALPVAYGIQLLRLIPRDDGVQQTQCWQVDVPGRRCLQTDAFGNRVQLVTVEGTHEELSIEAAGVVDTAAGSTGRIAADGLLSPLAYLATTSLTEADEAIAALGRGLFGPGLDFHAGAAALMERVTAAVRYRTGVTGVWDSARDALARGEGVCQDQAHVAIAACRAAGVPARYVSGYLFDAAAAQAASHAWIDLWDDDASSWLSCDVTHGRVAGEQLCRLAVGRDYLDAAPVRGVRRGGGDEALSVSVQVSATQQQQ